MEPSVDLSSQSKHHCRRSPFIWVEPLTSVSFRHLTKVSPTLKFWNYKSKASEIRLPPSLIVVSSVKKWKRHEFRWALWVRFQVGLVIVLPELPDDRQRMSNFLWKTQSCSGLERRFDEIALEDKIRNPCKILSRLNEFEPGRIMRFGCMPTACMAAIFVCSYTYYMHHRPLPRRRREQ